MVTRRSRCYKENTPSTALGRIILPAAVILAVILFYFSVKLFFFEPKDIEMKVPPAGIASNQTVQGGASGSDDYSGFIVEIDESDAAVLTPRRRSRPSAASAYAVKAEKPAAAQARPAAKEQKAQEPKAKSETPAAPRKTAEKETKPAQPAKNTAAAPNDKTSANKPKAEETAAWEVQIGGFSEADGARKTQQQAKDLGCRAYIIKTELDGKPFYKVRVKGAATKQEADEMSKMLSEKGFPTYIIIPGKSGSGK